MLILYFTCKSIGTALFEHFLSASNNFYIYRIVTFNLYPEPRQHPKPHYHQYHSGVSPDGCKTYLLTPTCSDEVLTLSPLYPTANGKINMLKKKKINCTIVNYYNIQGVYGECITYIWNACVSKYNRNGLQQSVYNYYYYTFIL